MHELSIAEALVRQVARAAQKEKAARVARIVVRIGTFSGVDPDALRAAFAITRESEESTRKSRLSMKTIKAKAKCSACGAISRPDFPAFACPRCGSDSLTFDGGRDLAIESVELAT
jgi:hydrogenase nickel incorporation protein HypA/HybF